MTFSIRTMIALLVASVSFPVVAADELLGAGQWDEETIELFQRVPVQDGGRNKPFMTYANFTLLPLNAKRSMETPSGQKLSATPWLLDCLFFPEQARDYKHFVVDNTEILTNVGIEAEAARERFSYNELQPGRDKLFEQAREYAQIDDKDRTHLERMTLNLAGNVNLFEAIITYLDFARAEHDIGGSNILTGLFPERSGLTMSAVLGKGPELKAAVDKLQSLPPNERNAELPSFGRLFSDIDRSIALPMFPPSDPSVTEWRSPSGILTALLETPEVDISGEVAMLASLERLTAAAGDTLAFKSELVTFQKLLSDAASARGEYNKIPMEVSFYNANYFGRALAFFVFSFVLVALSWLVVGSRAMNGATWVSVLVPLALLVVGITIRCIIQGRPPVTTLYETLLFITAVAVACALFIEYANRQRIAIAMAAFIGAAGMFTANRYELGDAQDTMPSLIAVLDTNFWLATHVTTVTIGYAAGMLAAAIAHVFVFGKLFGLRKNNQSFYRTLTRMVYGIVCFGLLFSFVGTVLGGIWANYSWGRFWGWDPKENGALMIVICNLAILHARLGGYIRDLGIHLGAVFCGMVVMFSHFGVNQLGVGLHSYGFTSGIWTNLIIFWIVESVVIAIGLGIALRNAFKKAIASEAQKLADDQATGLAK